jgi:hypothetical protein
VQKIYPNKNKGLPFNVATPASDTLLQFHSLYSLSFSAWQQGKLIAVCLQPISRLLD